MLRPVAVAPLRAGKRLVRSAGTATHQGGTMGATKDCPATQVREWPVGKRDEASKIDWEEKSNTPTASKPAYLRNGLLSAAVPSSPASAARGTGVSQADLDAAMVRAARAE